MQVAIQCASFTPDQADQLRRAMATFKITGGVQAFQDKLVDGMEANGYDARIRRAQTFKQIQGFGSYGFPGKPRGEFRHHRLRLVLAEMPPSGRVLLRAAEQRSRWASTPRRRSCADARDHGVEVRPVDVNQSRWDCTLGPDPHRHALGSRGEIRDEVRCPPWTAHGQGIV